MPRARVLAGRGGASLRGAPRPRLGSDLAAARAVRHASMRTWSKAAVAHATTWNASAQTTASGIRSATTTAIQSAPSADT